jgi:2-polyprenyl-3-methyl-5-hydroxy-6-metoxy-1,4-benzoquinol methylase
VRILDIGCGFGETLSYHKKRGCDVYGSEVDRNAAFFAAKFGLNIRIGPYNSNNYEKDFFDYITLDQVIEHVSDPIELLKGIYANLKEGGMAIISSPNAHGWGVKWYRNRWLHWHTPYHLHFYSKKSMRIAADKANLQITSVHHATLSEWLYWQWIHLIFMPKINEPSLYWKYMNKNIYSDNQLKQLEKLEKIRKYRIHDIITRFFDLLQIGDNQVFILKKQPNIKKTN